MSGSEKGWANPGPAGLVALAVAAVIFWATLTGRIDGSSVLYAACWLMGGFVIQFTVAIIELKEGSLTGGNTFLYFAGLFMLSGALTDLVAFWGKMSGVAMQSTVNGYAWLVLTVALMSWAPAFMKTTPAVFSGTVLDLIIMAWCVTFIKLGIAPAIFPTIAAYTALLGAIGALWCAAAFIMNPSFGREVVPLGKPLLK